MNTALYQTVAASDALSFFEGNRLHSKAVTEFLDLGKEDVAKIAGVSKSSVRFDNLMPKAVGDRLSEIANICNMVAQALGGDVTKTATWFRTKNPMLGDMSPRDMVRFGRYDKLRRFVIGAQMDALADRKAQQEMTARSAAPSATPV